jgi:menaquinone-dependent protoporphyrinogen oxidase
MASVLVAYGSGEGQTRKVAERLGETLTERGHDVTVARVTDEEASAPEAFDAVLVGSPVNYQKHRRDVVEFVAENEAAISARPNGFFQLSVASTVPFGGAQRADREYLQRFVDRTGWRPDSAGLFAGAVKYSRYGRVERLLFRLIASVTTGDTDTSRDYEYTDWDDVERFAVALAETVEARVEEEGDGRRSLARRFARLTGGAAVLAGAAGVAYWAVKRRGTPSGW